MKTFTITKQTVEDTENAVSVYVKGSIVSTENYWETIISVTYMPAEKVVELLIQAGIPEVDLVVQTADTFAVAGAGLTSVTADEDGRHIIISYTPQLAVPILREGKPRKRFRKNK